MPTPMLDNTGEGGDMEQRMEGASSLWKGRGINVTMSSVYY